MVDARTVNIENWTIVHSSGCGTYSLDSACSYIGRDTDITLTGEESRLARDRGQRQSDDRGLPFGDSNPARTRRESAVHSPKSSTASSERSAISCHRANAPEIGHQRKGPREGGVIENDNSTGYFNVRESLTNWRRNTRFRDIISVGYRVAIREAAGPFIRVYTEVGNPDALRRLPVVSPARWLTPSTNAREPRPLRQHLRCRGLYRRRGTRVNPRSPYP